MGGAGGSHGGCSVSRYARKVDDNHGVIVRTLRGLGAYVIDCAHVGSGFPDLLVGWRGRWTLVEVKDGAKSPSRRRLTADQIPLHAECDRRGLPCVVVTNEIEALALLGAKETA